MGRWASSSAPASDVAGAGWLYFNEFDRYPAAWLRNLYPAAVVDERSIVDVQPSDVAGPGRRHFFGGIGGWEYALDLAGWPADRDVWTGSCPCQPFSVAGRGDGAADPRHLWPAWYRLIRECRPDVVFGEQVPGAIGHGWLDGVCTDMEAEGYAVGAVVLGAHSVGAPHIRQRLYWGARMADANDPQRGQDAGRCGVDGCDRPHDGRTEAYGEPGACGEADPWSDAVLIPCADGRARPVGASIRVLAHGVPARASKLRAYGNAIVPQVAAAFIAAFLDAERELGR